MEVPETRYAKSGDLHIAYQVFGEGPIDLIDVPGFVTHVELAWEHPGLAAALHRLSSFARVAIFDKRGVGLSDRVSGLPPLEERMDDLRAVMDAAGMGRAAVLASADGGALAVLFAATYPERVSALVLSGTFARFVAARDYPWAASRDEWNDKIREVERSWGSGAVMGMVVPLGGNDAHMQAYMSRFERNSASPGAAAQLLRMDLEIDVRAVLGALTVPTLVIHRTGDPLWPVEHGRYLAEHIRGAKYLELETTESTWMRSTDASGGTTAPQFDDIEEFLTGLRPVPLFDRVLATVLFTDIVGSTEQAAALGDAKWRALLERHDAATRRAVERFRGRWIKHTGDGVLATFDGPARAAQCALEIGHAVEPLGVRVRAGVHTGEIEFHHDDLAGLAVHIGARVGALAGPGEVLATQTVRDLTVGSGLGFADRGEHDLKGVPGRWHLYAVGRDPG